MTTISDSNFSSTKRKHTNKFRMHQNDNNPQATKTIISFGTIIDSVIKINEGAGNYSDMVTLASVLSFCESKFESNPRLGFKEDLNRIRKSLGKVAFRATQGVEANINNWTCPFVTMEEQRNIEKLAFLVEHQYTNAPVLDTDVPLEEHYIHFINEKMKEL